MLDPDRWQKLDVSISNRIPRLQVWVLALLLIQSASIRAQEYRRDEADAPESAEEIEAPLQEIVEPVVDRPPSQFRIERGGPFWRDSEIDVNIRSFDFSRDNGLGALSEAVALGGEIGFRSGTYRDTLSVGATWYTSQGVDAPADKDGTGLLGPGQADISVLGKAYLQLDFESFVARLYRQDFNLPYLNRHDSRMIPNTHEGYILGRPGGTNEVGFVVGQITKMKPRNSSEFISMGEVAGISGSNAATSLFGVRFRPTGNFDIGAMTLLTNNLFNTTYVETNWRRSLDESWGLQLSAQYSDQRSNGRDRLGEFSTSSHGIRASFSYRNAILTLAHTATDEDAGIRSPYGGRPGYNSLMLFDFDRAGERASRIGLSYHFGRIGIPGLSIQLNRARGMDALDPVSGLGLADENETDLTIDFRPPSGPLQGLWIRFRRADGDRGDPVADRKDSRIIVNYDLPLF
jgi:hypothetical protein